MAEASVRPKTSRYTALGEGSSLLINLAMVVAFLVLWWLATHLGWIRPLFLPKPEAVWLAFQQANAGELDNGTLALHFGWSLFRVFTAFAIAALIAVPLGILMGVSRIARGLLDPPIEFYRPLPPLAYLPLIVIWFGIGEFSKILLIALACFAPVALAARSGARAASQEQINAARSLGRVPPRSLCMWCFPPPCLTFSSACASAWGSDGRLWSPPRWSPANAGLGQMVLNASNFLRTDVVVLGVIAIGIVAYAFELGMRLLERRIAPMERKDVSWSETPGDAPFGLGIVAGRMRRDGGLVGRSGRRKIARPQPAQAVRRAASSHFARIASSSSATMLVILIAGLTAGPAVSL